MTSSVAALAGAVSVPTLPIKGGGRFGVRRIFCVGRNYAAHAREMGANPEREAPFFFAKPADAVVLGGGELPFPVATGNLHHEIELVVALGSGGHDIETHTAPSHVLGYAVGLDMTRRDLQDEAKKTARPWDMSKGFDQSAPITAIYPAAAGAPLERGAITLEINGEIRQSGDLADMIWTVPEMIAALSRLVALKAGDLIFTGTPSGVGPVEPGDRLRGRIDGLEDLVVRYAAAD